MRRWITSDSFSQHDEDFQTSRTLLVILDIYSMVARNLINGILLNTLLKIYFTIIIHHIQQCHTVLFHVSLCLHNISEVLQAEWQGFTGAMKYVGLVTLWIYIFITVTKWHIILLFFYPWFKQMILNSISYFPFIETGFCHAAKVCLIQSSSICIPVVKITGVLHHNQPLYLSQDDCLCFNYSKSLLCNFESKTSINILNPL